MRRMPGSVPPAFHVRDMDVDLVAEAAGEVAGHLLKVTRFLVKGRHGWEDDRPGLMDPQHVGQVGFVQRRFPYSQEQRPPLLQAYVRGPVDQVAREAGGNRAQGAGGAGQDDHGVIPAGAAGHGGGEVVAGEPAFDVGQVRRLLVQFQPQYLAAGIRDDRIHQYLLFSQQVEQRLKVEHAGGSGDGQDDPLCRFHFI